MKILHITPLDFAAKGHTLHHLDTIRVLSEAGHSSSVICTHSAASESSIRGLGAQYLGVEKSGVKGLGSISFESNARSLLRQNESLVDQHDLLIVETTGIRAIPPSQTCPAKTILWDKSPPTELGVIGHLQRLYWSRVWRKHSQRASYYLFQSEEHRQFMEARFPLSHGESIVFENGVDVGKFSLPESEPDPNVLVYAGMVSRTRGIPQLIRSCKAIYKEKPNLRLHILGRGEYLSKAKGEMRKNPWLQVHGFIEDEAEFKGIFNSAGVGVIPHPDYFWWQICAPLKLFEYAASGKTVAAISMPSHDKYGDQKWFCVGDEGNTVESLTSSINSAIESSGDPNNRKLARSFAEENFTFETNLRDLIDRISSI